MIEYSDVQVHREENITLLCPFHHDEKSRKRLPLSRVQFADRFPHNRKQSSTTPYHLHYGGEGAPSIWMAENAWTWAAGPFCPLMIDGTPVIVVRPDLETGEALFSAIFFDKYNERVLQIVDNELTFSAGLWDVEYVGTRLTLRSGPGDIFLQLNFRVADNVLDVERGQILLNGARVVLDDEGLTIGQASRPIAVKRSHFEAEVGIVIGQVPPGARYAFQVRADRYEG